LWQVVKCSPNRYILWWTLQVSIQIRNSEETKGKKTVINQAVCTTQCSVTTHHGTLFNYRQVTDQLLSQWLSQFFSIPPSTRQTCHWIQFWIPAPQYQLMPYKCFPLFVTPQFHIQSNQLPMTTPCLAMCTVILSVQQMLTQYLYSVQFELHFSSMKGKQTTTKCHE
jgi:hypothetical protein